MQILDPLSYDPSTLNNSPNQAFDYIKQTPPNHIFTGYHFFHYLNQAKGTYLWVMTYTFNPINTLSIPVERLIYSVGTPRNNAMQLHGIHTKLYIQFCKQKIVGAYLGSQNLVRPTNANLMIKVPKAHHKFVKDYFLHFWKQA